MFSLSISRVDGGKDFAALNTRGDGGSRIGGVRVGVDIGGTFTDLVAQSGARESWRVKVPTSSPDPARGALEAVQVFLRDYHVDPARVQVVIHATTLASNALLTGRIPKTGLVTTQGFRDVLEIGRQNRPELYNLQVDRLPPLIPRRYRFEVEERVSYEGKILKPLDRDGARRLERKTSHLGMESVAVCFLNAYANPEHEIAVARILRQEDPKLLLSISSELLPEFREYERTSTTVVNACLQPLMSRYLAEFRRGLAELGINAPLFVMQSNSGTLLSTQAAQEPARIIESGPVAGAVASKAYGKQAQLDDIISLDVGGTTSKAGVWTGQRFDLTDEYEVGGKIHGVRRLTGSGHPVGFPYVDLVEVGTGGGSIAHVDGASVLHVGPESAGSSPGPACYGRGGDRPTLTDANLVLGRLNPEYLLGGELKVDSGLAEKTVREHVAGPLKTGVLNAAVGILRIAVANMAGALRAASLERGHDPRGMTLVAFGGAGPMHACEIAEQLEIKRVLVPPWAGLFSSLGLLLADPLHDFVRTVLVPIDKADGKALTKTFEALEKKGRTLLREERVNDENLVFERFFDMRYEGQAFEISVPVARKPANRLLIRQAVRAFHRAHQEKYGYADPDNNVELVNLRVYSRGMGKAMIPRIRGQRTSRLGPRFHRRVFLGGRFVENCPIYDRRDIRPRSRGRGPCVVEDYDSTLVLPARARYTLDKSGSFKISLS